MNCWKTSTEMKLSRHGTPKFERMESHGTLHRVCGCIVSYYVNNTNNFDLLLTYVLCYIYYNTLLAFKITNS